MIATIVIAALIFGAVGYIIGKGIYDRVRHRGGGCSCGGSCWQHAKPIVWPGPSPAMAGQGPGSFLRGFCLRRQTRPLPPPCGRRDCRSTLQKPTRPRTCAKQVRGLVGCC